MPSLLSPLRAKRLRRSLYNLQVSLSCFVLTVLVLRNTIGAGRFGTPAQDFEELKHHLHQVALSRKRARVLAEAIEEDEMARSSAATTPSALLSAISFSDPSILDGWNRLSGVPDARSGASKVMIVTGSWPSFCTRGSGAGAESLYQQFLRNKLAFSESHGMEILFHTGSDMPDRPSLLLHLMQDSTARGVEWLWWMDSDSLITDASFELPLDRYVGRNLVLLGNAGAEGSGTMDAMMEEMGGSFLIRNCEWSLHFLKRWLQVSSEAAPTTGGSAATDDGRRDYGNIAWNDDKVLCDHSYSLRIDGNWLERGATMEWPALVSFQRCHDLVVADGASCLWQMETALHFMDRRGLPLILHSAAA